MSETSTGLREGQETIGFELPDEEGRPYNLFGRLEEGPLVLVFYRGDWWAYCNGQLVSFARSYEEFEKRGFGLAGISVDPPSRNAAMVEKLGLPFHLLSDPRGEVIKRLGLWNEDEGVSEPAIVVLDRSGTTRYLYSGGKDFSDRPYEESLFGLLDEVDAVQETGGGEPEVSISAEEAENETVRPDKPVMTLEQLKVYYRGAYFSTVAMKKKFAEEMGSEGEVPTKIVDGYQKLVNEYNAAIQDTTKT